MRGSFPHTLTDVGVSLGVRTKGGHGANAPVFAPLELRLDRASPTCDPASPVVWARVLPRKAEVVCLAMQKNSSIQFS